MTAAHCVTTLWGISGGGSCPPPIAFPVELDQQRIDGLAAVRTTGPTTTAREVIGGHDAFFTDEDGNCVPDETGFGDLVVLKLDAPLGETRGWARIRDGVPEAGALVNLVHNPNGEPEKFLAGRVLDFGGGPRQIPVKTLQLAGDPGIQPGSSGAGLFDPDGYVVGVMSRMGSCAGTACERFAKVEARAEGLGLIARRETRKFALARFDVSGTFEAFSTGITDLPGSREQPNAIALDGSGISLAGFASLEGQRIFAVARYHLDGSPDSAFGAGGSVATDFPGSSDEAFAGVTAQLLAGQEYVVAAGHVSDPQRLAVARYLSNGDLDGGFGAGADVESNVVVLDVPGLDGERLTDVAVDSAGRIVAAGTGWLPGARGRPIVVRLNPDGTRDASCDADGIFEWAPIWDDPTIEIPVEVVVTRLAVEAGTDDIILVGYLHYALGLRSVWIGRLRGEDCSPDALFGQDGSGTVVVTAPDLVPDGVNPGGTSGHSWASDVITLGGGRLRIATTVATYDEERGLFAGEMGVMGLNRLGAADLTFALGNLFFPLPRGIRWHETAQAIGVQQDGSLVVAGRSYRHTNDGDVNTVRLYRVDPGGLIRRSSALGNLPGPDEWATDLAIAPDGEIIVSARAMVE